MAGDTRHALVVHAHPLGESLSTALREAAVRGLTQAGFDVDVVDLYAESFTAAMSSHERVHYEELDRTLAPDVARQAELVRAADTLVFVYPTWWFSMPAILKGWFDRVMVPGVAFHLDPATNKVRSDLRHVRRIAAITTSGADRAYLAALGNGGKWMVTRTLRMMCSWRCRTTWLSLDKVMSRTDEERTAFIATVEQKMAAM